MYHTETGPTILSSTLIKDILSCQFFVNNSPNRSLPYFVTPKESYDETLLWPNMTKALSYQRVRPSRKSLVEEAQKKALKTDKLDLAERGEVDEHDN